MGTVWRGYVDGAVESGVRAAREIVEKLWTVINDTDQVGEMQCPTRV